MYSVYVLMFVLLIAVALFFACSYRKNAIKSLVISVFLFFWGYIVVALFETKITTVPIFVRALILLGFVLIVGNIINWIRWPQFSINIKYACATGIICGVMYDFLIYGERLGNYRGDAYQNFFWFENYETGFLSRGLIGQVMCIIDPYWTQAQLYWFKISIAFIFFGLLALFVSNMLSESEYEIVLLLSFIIIGSPLTKLVFWDNIRTDIVLLLLMIIAVICITYGKQRLTFVPILATLLVFCNETSCLTIVPMLLGVCYYEIKLNRSKGYLFTFVCSSILTFFSAVLSSVYGKGGMATEEDVLRCASKHYEGYLDISPLRAEFFCLKDHFEYRHEYFVNNWREDVVAYIMLLPILFLLLCFIVTIYRKSIIGKEKGLKVAFLIMVISPFFTFSATLLAADFMRYFMLFFFEEIIIVCYLIKKNKVIVNIDEISLKKGKSYKVALWVICIYYAISGSYTASTLGTANMLSFFK